MEINAQYLVSTVASQLNIDQTTAQTVVGVMLSVLEHEAGAQAMDPVLSKVQGAADLARQYDVMTPSPGGGMLGSLGSIFGAAAGEKTGALVNGVSRLEATGLSMAQVRQAGASLLTQARSVAGPEAVASILKAAPLAAGHFSG